MKHFFDIQDDLLTRIPKDFQRFLYSKIHFSNRLFGIRGPRGVGKTTLLLQYLKTQHPEQQQALYASLDDIYFSTHSLVDFGAQFLEEYDGKLLILDEVHKYSNWEQEIKNLYDRYPRLRVIFSGSSSLDLIRGNYDLSRRAIMYDLPGLSFREYLELKKGISLPPISIPELLENSRRFSTNIKTHINPLKELKEYLEKGYYPFFLESSTEREYLQRVNSTIEKTIYLDIARVHKLSTGNLPHLQKILYFLSTIPPGEVNTNNLAKHLGIAHETAAEYLEFLRQGGLIRYLLIDARGSKLVRNAAKIFLDNPNMVKSVTSTLDQPLDVGQIRELFVLNQAQNAGLVVSRPEDGGDLCISKNIFEIGGKNKTWGEFPKDSQHYLVMDGITTGEKNVIPMYLFGFLY